MRSENILKANVLDIIFENRNKSYGAYDLRKYYHMRLYKALGITFLLIFFLWVFSLMNKRKSVVKVPELVTILGSISQPVIEKPTDPPKPPKQPEKPRQQSIPMQARTEIFTSVINFIQVDNKATRLAMNLDNVEISNATTEAGGGEKQVTAGQTNSIGNNGDIIKPIDKNKPVTNAEVMPSYPGGETALIKFLQQNLHNPETLADDEIISVKIRFIVGFDGILKGFEILEDGGIAFNNEVIRVLKKMPAWIPGKAYGENVSVYFSIPVKFVSQE